MDNGTGPLVQVKEVVKSFPVGGGEITVLKGISFDVKNGEFVSIVGPSGNGKSTLLNMITGIDRPTHGEVIVTGREVHRMSENQLAAWRGQHVGHHLPVLPDAARLQPAAERDAADGFRQEIFDRASAKSGPCSCWRPSGWPTRPTSCPAWFPAASSSARAIARALANDPDLIVADEPTGNLDTRTAQDVFDLFNGWSMRARP